MKRTAPRHGFFQWKLSLYALVVILLATASLTLAPFAGAQNPNPSASSMDGAAGPSGRVVYPESKKVEVIDDYFGTMVADPYRWLENEKTPEVSAWVEAQNKVTFAYLDQIPYRQKIKERLTALFNYPRYSAPSRRGKYFFFTKNDGLQNQSVWYRQKGLDGTTGVLLHPNKLSKDGISRLGQFSLS